MQRTLIVLCAIAKCCGHVISPLTILLLYFVHRFKTVGPFVVMIYRMITGDLLRFVIIYLVFVMGFSQAFFIIFLSYNKPKTPNPLGSPAESVIAMFMMSLSSFESTFDSFQYTDHEEMAWVLFVVYMAIVTILLINMLIAMMGNTYTKIAETRNEWQRQVNRFWRKKIFVRFFKHLNSVAANMWEVICRAGENPETNILIRFFSSVGQDCAGR